MLDAYLVFSVVFSMIWIIAVVWCAMEYFESYSRRTVKARRLLMAIISLPAAWLWPLTVPCAIVYALVLLVRDADLDFKMFQFKQK